MSKGLVVGVLCLLVAATGIWLALRSASCQEETIYVASLAHEDVRVVYTNCDTLAKDESISVYLLAHGATRLPSLVQWFSTNTLVKYDPAVQDRGPTIKDTADGALSITVPRVSSVILQESSWQKRPIQYSIGQIDYR